MDNDLELNEDESLPEEEDSDKPRRRGGYITKNKQLEEQIAFLANEVKSLREEKAKEELKRINKSVEDEVERGRNYLYNAVASKDATAEDVVNANDQLIQARIQNELAKRLPLPSQHKERRKTPELDQFQQDNPWLNNPEYPVESQTAIAIDSNLKNRWINQYGEESLYGTAYIRALNDLLKQNEATKKFYNEERPQRGRMVAGVSSDNTGNQGKQKISRGLYDTLKMAGQPVDDPAYIEKMNKYQKETADRLKNNPKESQGEWNEWK